jgi:putative membrane protein
MHRKFFTASLSLALLLSTGSSPNQATDTDFMNTAAQANLAEIDAGKLASVKAADAAVRSFAKTMVADHTTAQMELSALAGRRNVSLPQTPDTEHQSSSAQLAKLSGRSFDSTYINMQFLDHQVAIDLFRQENNVGKDTAARAYAAKYLPKLQHHMMMAKQLWKK